MSQSVPVVAIDGPSGSGKGTIAQLVAQKLNWHLLDSGALYRVLALCAKNHGMSFENRDAITVLAAHMDVQFKSTELNGVPSVILEGEDVTDLIRTEEAGKGASLVAAIPEVRTALLDRQKAFRELPGLVADGRDMGTVVFPDACAKIFLTASAEERATRRVKQLQQRGLPADFDGILNAIKLRDEQDINRAVAPLVPADDAVILDSTGLNIEQVLSRVAEILLVQGIRL